MKKWITLLVSVLCVQLTYSQFDVELGECDQGYNDKTEAQVNKALSSFEKKDYRMAKIYVNNILEMDPKNAHGLYLMGEVAMRGKPANVNKAIAYWSQLIDVCPNYRAEVQFFLGVLLLENGNKKKSEEMMKLFLANPERDRGFDKEAESILEEIHLQETLFANPVPFDPKPIMSICTRDDEYLAVISPDAELCFFTRRSKKVDKYSGPAAKTRIVEEFVMAKRNEDGSFEKGDALGYPFNENYNEGGPTITANNRELYFTVCQRDKTGAQNCDIYYCIREGLYWGEIENLGDHINTEAWESQPSVSADGKTLYFVSNRKGGVGGLDIYKCERELNGKWSAPVNLGKSINTRKNEKSPFIHSDSKTLYFASDGHATLGGYDIYYAKKDELDNYDKPINIGYPINTKADEIALFVSLDGQRAYFSSNKLKGPGGWDFYGFNLHAAARPEQVALVKGTLLDEQKEVVQGAKLQIKNIKTKELQDITVDQFTGEYAAIVQIKEQENLILKVEKEGTAFTSKLIDIEDEEVENGVVEAEFEVAPIEVGKEYRLNDIKFATDSYELSEKAKLVIDEFLLFLGEQPRIKVDIQGHTDNAGSAEDNLTLSKNRAKVVYNYLVDHGVSSSRLSWHGFGQSKPIADNKTKKGMAKNRRTVFVITSK